MPPGTTQTELPDRHTTRLPGFDYTSAAVYFITIVCNDRQHHFGHIADGHMHLSEAGRIAAEEWQATTNIRPDAVTLHPFVVMPNHFHALIQLHKPGHDDTILTNSRPFTAGIPDVATSLTSPSRTLGAIVRGFKGAVTRRLGHPVWQRGYYEHIIRDYRDYTNIAAYIAENPQRWQHDRFH